ncbi:MAG: multicopper oxidase domain-containing protein [Chloroflexi bacterium]|jgi:FtsP/CotA-like multicopper oxidase with cupredoxin domain|nr:multicopper oxidase domain-containing protein [Anaerolineaceae bacterium]NLI44299.1 multicopper oxidase domain-containing protein [Chloroflexota bacterium]HOE35772.1 multicopper oxidase domain-containing protein [Anaerolineaceae bacterium]HOT26439.1 multicopper oxidase domain-containing protein [Anaerolineaceae bacterium]HQH57993.1 multicopper oxidase domain-containing protein [Anaerolineaceae bacterium]
MKTKMAKVLILIGMLLGAVLNGAAAVIAQSVDPPSVPPGQEGLVFLDGRVTAGDIQKAAEQNRKAGILPGVAGLRGNAAQNSLDTIIPHYFGPYPNYANSPMPKGPVGFITVDAAGSGYTNPQVEVLDVYGTGSGALAQAIVSNGKIASISLTNPGANYTAPIVAITDPTGSGAEATAHLSANLSGGIRKFIDSLPGLGPENANNLGQFLPVAVPDTTTFPGSDYYEIELGKFTHQFNSDLPPTTVLGYRQTNSSDPNVNQFRYLGPTIIAQKDVPVRIKFTNSLPTGEAGDLFLPVDTTVMGAGEGPIDQMGMECDPMMPMPGMECQLYKQNRATVHLHGGFVPWISDGTPHQWTTPANEDTPYPRGVSVRFVPDMWFENGNVLPGASTTNPNPAVATNDPGDGSLTFYYNNQQSARLMFYHDHSFGITRLNVYAGEAAAYLLSDQIEQDLINGTNLSGVNPDNLQILPGYGIPLVIQDKTFVDAFTILAQDPTWRWGTTPGTPNTGDLWVSSVYMPAQNPYSVEGVSAYGRWQYGAWFWPPTTGIEFPPVPNEYYDPNCDPQLGWCEPPMRPNVPHPSMGMEAFMDTPTVNGTAYPYLEVDPTVVRFRILNAADDRFFNLHLYVADPSMESVDGRRNTEVRMVPAVATPGFPEKWSTDGREGGVPDPALMGPDWIQIGTEGGFLPEPAIIPPQPINWQGDVTLFNAGNVTDHSLLVGTAERADVLVDFSNYAGKTLILYNDAPAAFPAIDPRYDYYTGHPDLTSSGGTPTTQAGYGPNTRTLMQIRVRPAAGGGTGVVSSIQVLNGGQNFNTMPLVDIFGGGGSGAEGYALGSVDRINITNPGVNLTYTPQVIISGGGGTGAQAVANMANGKVVSITVTNPGSGYTSAPTVTLVPGPYQIFAPLLFGSGPGGPPLPPNPLWPVAVATLRVDEVVLTSGGSSYETVPLVNLVGGGGFGATAVANLQSSASFDLPALMQIFARNGAKPGVFEAGQDRFIIPQTYYNSAYGETYPSDMRMFVQLQDYTKSFYNGPLPGILVTAGGSGYTEPPLVTITGGGGSGAEAVAEITGDAVTAVTLTNPGQNYTSAPTISFTGGGGTGAVAAAVPITIPLNNKAIQDEMGEAFDQYGRMSGFLGLELDQSSATNQTFLLYPFLSPLTDLWKASITSEPIGSLEDGTQIWKITHNGVDTHTIHIHLVNAQVINRVAWDGLVMPPEANELGWKETIRVNPLEHTIIAMRPAVPTQPFEVPNSVRLIDPTRPEGVELMGGPLGFQDPTGIPITVSNSFINYGWEYVWHCHLLSHEEMDMMHALGLAVAPNAPGDLLAELSVIGALLTWTDNSISETEFLVQRAEDEAGPWTTIATLPADTVSYEDAVGSGSYFYRVIAVNVVGDRTVYAAPAVGFPTIAEESAPSNIVTITIP